MRRMTSVIARPMIGIGDLRSESDQRRAGHDAERDEAVDSRVLPVGGHRRTREATARPRAEPARRARCRRTRSAPRQASTQRWVRL